MIEATTGLALTKDQLSAMANEITQQTRRYNAAEGLDAACDTLPHRFLTEKTKEGASLTRQDLDTMLAEYDNIRGAVKDRCISP